MTIQLKAVEQYFTVVLFGFGLGNLSILDSALSGVRELAQEVQSLNSSPWYGGTHVS